MTVFGIVGPLSRSREPDVDSLGQIVATPAAQSVLAQPDIITALRRHASALWDEVDADDQATNDEALTDGIRLFSAYTATNRTRFWIITEADRSVTTVLLPDAY